MTLIRPFKEYLGRALLRRGYLRSRSSMHNRGAAPVWLDRAQWDRLICFVHIPKCAGSSVKYALWKAYGKGFLTYHTRLSPYDPSTMTHEQAKDILALGGHFHYGFHRRFGDDVFANRDVFYVSVVRDPVDRLLSLARFARSVQTHRLYKATKNMNCAEFFAFAEANHMDILGDQQSRLLTGNKPDRSLEFVRDRYLAVSTVASAPDMLAALGERLGWPEIKLEHKNKSPKALTEDGDRELAESLCERFCKNDLLLYRYVASQPGGLIVSDVL
jgi:Sulfotransferase family